MVQTVTAKYEDGFLKPTTALDLDEGDVVVVTVSGRRITAKDVEASRSSAGAWRGNVDAEKVIADLYEARIQGSAHMFDGAHEQSSAFQSDSGIGRGVGLRGSMGESMLTLRLGSGSQESGGTDHVGTLF